MIIEWYRKQVDRAIENLLGCGAELQDVLDALKDISEGMDVIIQSLEDDIERAEEQAEAMRGKGELV